jgi:hypothetical protein
MAIPPSNRRPGIDVGVVQSEWIRGYDVPAGDQSVPPLVPCDLIISNGKDQTSGGLSNLIFASRSDSPEQAMFVMGQGADPKAPSGTVKFHIGQAANPNGIVNSSTSGSLYASYGTPGLWQVQADNTTWVKISDDLGGESLQQTLAIGNSTGGNNIVVTDGDAIVGENGIGGDVLITGGTATGVAGTGGGLFLTSGTSTGGQSGPIQIATANALGAAGVQPITLSGGSSALGGAGGGINIHGGQGGGVGVPGAGGGIQIRGGRSVATGPAVTVGGRLELIAGQTTSDGRGGSVQISAGDAKNTTQAIQAFFPIKGRGGDVAIDAGDSSLSEPGGAVVLRSGSGGPAGGEGGKIILQPGAGGGGADAGIVDAQGVFQAQNIKRGTADPNAINLQGNEGDIYQRTDTGLGQVWANTNGTPTGWVQLAFAGDLVEAFEQLQYGYLAPSMRQFGGPAEEYFSDVGLFKGMRFAPDGVGAITQTVVGNGPVISLSVTESINATQSALDMQTFGASGSGVQSQNKFLATFVINTSSVDANATRFFVGLTNNSATNQLANTFPGGRYVGFMRDDTSPNWVVLVKGPGGHNFFNTGVPKASVNSIDDFYYFVIDAKDFDLPVVRFFILDSDLTVISSISVPTATFLPSATDTLWPCLGVRTFNAGAPNTSTLRVANATLTTRSGLVGQGAGTGSGVLSLAQVLVNGNETGGNPILINQTSGGILGVTDDNAGDGASFGIFGGLTTGAASDSGSVTLASGNRFVGGSGNTGFLLLSSGAQFDAAATGDTGPTTLTTGPSAGTSGSTGDLILATGQHVGGASASIGDIAIAPGSFASNNAVPGNVDIRGGSTSLLNQKGGAVAIRGGQSTSSSGDTGDVIVSTIDANLNGDSGDVFLLTGGGGSNTGNSGLINIRTGIGVAGGSGGISLVTGAANNGSAGSIIISTGLTTSGNGADVVLTGGVTTDALGVGGDIQMTPGTGPSGDGAVVINGKLTVTGLIDPTGLQLTGQASTPVAVLPAGDGLLWVDNTASPSRLIFRDDTGVDSDISVGGGATDLNSLTDVSIAGAVPGEVLTFTGVQWQNLPGIGGSPLSTILGIGNETGNTAGGILVSTGDRVFGQTDLVLDPGGGVTNQVVIDGLRWPNSDGIAGYVLTTDGAGNLTFQPGGGGSSVSFGEAFTRMQWGSVQAATDAPYWNADGFFGSISVTGTGPVSTPNTTNGYVFQVESAAVIGALAGIEIEQTSTGIKLFSRALVSFKFDGPDIDTNINTFVGLTSAPNIGAQTSTTFPLYRYVGLQLYTGAGQTTWHFVTDNATGIPTTVNTSASALGEGFELVLDATVPGVVTLTLYDNTGTQLATTTFASNLPTDSVGLGIKYAATTLNATAKYIGLYNAQAVTRGDLLNSVGGGGGGSQDLNSVLGIGNTTGGIPIRGDDNAAGSGDTLALQGGNSTGGGGAGGNVNIRSGDPDPAGNSAGGDLELSSASGAGGGGGGGFQVSLGGSGPLGGSGGSFRVNAGNGPSAGSGTGGGAIFNLGAGGNVSGAGGGFLVNAGNAIAGNSLGGEIELNGGNGFGTGKGGDLLFVGGDGGAAGGDGGSLNFTVGTGNGGGADGEIFLNGDTTITGKLTVTGLIDPTGLLLTSQPALPFTPVGNDGGIWINNSGELIYSNAGGDLNLSTAIGGGLTFLDAFLEAGYGMLSPGNSVSPIQSYGIYGGSVVTFVGPGPGQILFGGSSGLHDTDGPIATLAAAAAANSEARIAVNDKSIRRDQRFKAVFKFQTGGLPHTDERIFIGFTNNDANQINQGPADDPAGNQYVGLREDLAGVNLRFVARGSGGAMTPVFGVPTAITDASAHYFVIDATDAGGAVTFSIVANDGITILVSHTEPAGFVLPDVTEPLQAFVGIYTQGGGSPHSLDFFQHTVITRADVVDAVTGGGGGGGTPTLSSVLASGNTTGGTPLLVDSNIFGDAVDLRLFGGSSGGLGGVSLLTLATEAGDNGAHVFLDGGAGGGLAGQGGSITLSSGNGAGTGLGGNLVLASGNGGPGGGNSGEVTISGGDGLAGNAVGGDVALTGGVGAGAGRGGHIELEGGAGGATGEGGYIIATAGASSSNQGGVLLLAGGVAPSFIAGTVRAESSPSANADGSSFVLNPAGTAGGNLRLFGGDGNVGNTSGGWVLIEAGAGSGSGNGGDLIFTSGLSSTGVGGDTSISAANGGAGGGSVSITAGSASAAGNGGSFSVLTGGSANGNGGGVSFTTSAGGLNGDGGAFEILCGNGVGTGNGGDLIFTAGNSGPGVGGDAGTISLSAGDNATGVDRGGTVSVFGGGGLATSQGGSVTIAGGDIGSAVVSAGLYEPSRGGAVTIRGGASDLNASGGGVLVSGGLSGSGVGLSGGRVTISGGSGRSGTNNDGGDLQLQGGSAAGAGSPGRITIGAAGRGDTLNPDSPAFKFGSAVFTGGVSSRTFTWGVGPLAAYTAFDQPPRMLQITVLKPPGLPAPYAVLSSFDESQFTVVLYLSGAAYAAAGDEVIHFQAIL